MRVGKLLFVATVLGALPLAAQGAQPAVGTMAPDFTLPGATSAGVLAKPVKLSDLRGRTPRPGPPAARCR